MWSTVAAVVLLVPAAVATSVATRGPHKAAPRGRETPAAPSRDGWAVRGAVAR